MIKASHTLSESAGDREWYIPYFEQYIVYHSSILKSTTRRSYNEGIR